MRKLLKLPAGGSAKRANLEHLEELKRKLASPPKALYGEVRELLLRKCQADELKPLQAIFAQHPSGEIERLVTQKLLDLVKAVARQQMEK